MLTPKESANGGAVKIYDPNKTHSVRRPKKGDHLARSLVKAYKGLPEGVNHPLQMLDTFNAAYPELSITPNAARLYTYLYKRTSQQDWHKDRLALVWPSNETIINDLNICDSSALKKLFRQLRDIGLIAYKDSPTRKRYGERLKNGLIDYPKSFGIVLNSIAGLYESLQELARRSKIKHDYRKKIKRAVTIYRRERDDLLTAAHTLLRAVEIDNALIIFNALDAQIADSGRDYGLKEVILEHYRAALDALAALILEASSTLSPFEPLESSDQIEQMEGFEIKKPRTGGKIHPSIRTITTSTPIISNRLSDNNSNVESVINPSSGFQAKRLAKIRKMEEEAQNGELVTSTQSHIYKPAKVSFNQVKTALPYKLRDSLRDDYGFFELYDILKEDARDLLIPGHIFDEARQLLGIEITCACYAKILHMGDNLRSPVAYLKGMMDKYRNGALRIERSLFGIIKESQKSKTMAQSLFD